jgi:hypothetical protein
MTPLLLLSQHCAAVLVVDVHAVGEKPRMPVCSMLYGMPRSHTELLHGAS